MFLKADTAATVVLGPFVSISDGITPVTTLTAGTVDEIGIYKDSATALTDLSGTTTFTHRAGGIYTATLATGDTNLEGRLDFYVRDDSVCLPRRERFQVVKSNVFDGLFSQAATTTLLQTNTNQIGANASAATNLAGIMTGSAQDVAIAALSISDGIDVSKTTAGNTIIISSGAGDAGVGFTGGAAGFQFASATRAMDGLGMENFSDLMRYGIVAGTVTSATSTTVTTALNQPADAFKDMVLLMTSGDEQYEHAHITTSSAGPNVVLTHTGFTGTPSNPETFIILGRATA